MPSMSEVWHGQVLDRVLSAEMCRLDVWVFERDRAVLIATAPGKAPDIGSLVLGEALGDAGVHLKIVAASQFPSDFSPLIPVSRDAGSSVPVLKLDATLFQVGDEVVGEVGMGDDVGLAGRM